NDAFGNERECLDLAALPDHDTLPDFNEGADLGFIADLTAVEVDQIGLVDGRVPAELHVILDHESSLAGADVDSVRSAEPYVASMMKRGRFLASLRARQRYSPLIEDWIIRRPPRMRTTPINVVQ